MVDPLILSIKINPRNKMFNFQVIMISMFHTVKNTNLSSHVSLLRLILKCIYSLAPTSISKEHVETSSKEG